MDKNAKIYIAGHRGMVGSALVRKFSDMGFKNLLLRSREELNLLDQQKVFQFLDDEKPEYIIIAAAKVGGIMANNTYRAEFLYENLIIESNLIHGAHLANVNNLLFLGSSCIYPRNCPQPMKEEYLLTGLLERTNEPYAIAKIAGIKLCENYSQQYGRNYFSVMPTNLYGPNDSYNLDTSHVLPALIRKIYLARLLELGDYDGIHNDLKLRNFSVSETYNPKWGNAEIRSILRSHGICANRVRNDGEGQGSEQTGSLLVVSLNLWGSGAPRREFLHVDDMAQACVFLLQNYYKSDFLNIGCGVDVPIKELAFMVREIIGFMGEIKFDHSKPDGTPQKLLDVSRLSHVGWNPSISLEEGVRRVFEDDYLAMI